ncbi:membrane protein [Clostridia bacterium]|nr:membrane protein [Clostridia bacterium]
MKNDDIKKAYQAAGADKAIGGQAVIEGVMMRGKRMYAIAVRTPDGHIETVREDVTPVSDKYKLFKLPILRGIASFLSSLVVGMEILMKSAEIAGENLEDEEPSKFERYLIDKFGETAFMKFLIYVSVAVALVISVAVFMLLPVYVGGFFEGLLKGNTWALGIIEGTVRIALFLGYLSLVGRNRDIQRVFQYHGAEHKTINCFEADCELTPEKVAEYPRLHKRCGTSFLLIVMVISMIVFLFLRTDVFLERVLWRVLLVPFIAGASYEFIKWAGRSKSKAAYYLSYPGLCLQKVTTREPDLSQIETAITALKEVLKSENNEGAVAGGGQPS